MEAYGSCEGTAGSGPATEKESGKARRTCSDTEDEKQKRNTTTVWRSLPRGLAGWARMVFPSIDFGHFAECAIGFFLLLRKIKWTYRSIHEGLDY